VCGCHRTRGEERRPHAWVSRTGQGRRSRLRSPYYAARRQPRAQRSACWQPRHHCGCVSPVPDAPAALSRAGAGSPSVTDVLLSARAEAASSFGRAIQPGAPPKPHTVGSLQFCVASRSREKGALAAPGPQITETVPALVPCKSWELWRNALLRQARRRIFLERVARFPEEPAARKLVGARPLGAIG